MLVGSANIDLVVHSPRFPKPGETLQGSDFRTFPGGKGANQATASAKVGAKTSFLAKVGTDRFGDQLFQSLSSNGVDTEHILRDPSQSTGVALITVDSKGQNTIVVAPGTNAMLTPLEVRQALQPSSFKVLLVQLEIPMTTVETVALNARKSIFILNPAPAFALSDAVLCRVDYLTPNETETHLLTGILPRDSKTCLEAANVLLDKGVKNVLITLGKHGSFLANHQGGRHFPPIEVKPIDTTAAGDAFNGALAAFLATGEEIDRAIHLGNVAGALCTTKAGAQDAMPTLDEILDAAN